MELVFIRHGQSANNALWSSSGSNKGRSYDPPLTDLGRRQAECVAEFIRHDLHTWNPLGAHGARHDPASTAPPLTHLYTSLMTRAVDTGIVIARALDLPLRGWVEIHESGGLYLEDEITGEKVGQPGRARAEWQAVYPQLVLPEDLAEGGWWDRPHEEREERPLRARRVWNLLLERHGGTDDRVGLIAHGGFYNHLLQVIIGFARADGSGSEDGGTAAPDKDIWFALNNCALSRVDVNARGVAFVFLNRFDFLPPELVSL
jgi:2,3-bisphosphoglycerate-dependent phosphoglycerate mutase